MCGWKFLKKDKNQGGKIYEDLTEKIYNGNLPTKSLGLQTLSLQKKGLHSIEDCIATETKFSNIMRRLETIETKESVS